MEGKDEQLPNDATLPLSSVRDAVLLLANGLVNEALAVDEDVLPATDIVDGALQVDDTLPLEMLLVLSSSE